MPRLSVLGCLPHEDGAPRLLRTVLTPGSVFVDIGANVGYFTRMASKLVGEQGRVLAFEPMPRAERILRLNTRDLSNVEVFPVALSSVEGLAEFYVRKRGDTSSLHEAFNLRPGVAG